MEVLSHHHTRDQNVAVPLFSSQVDGAIKG